MTTTTPTRVAVITGAGRGIGAAVALQLAADGFDIALVARSTKQIDNVAKQVRALGRQALAVTCDVQNPSSVTAAVADVAAWGPIEVLVNNAGRGGGGPTADVADEVWNEIIGTNLNSVFFVTKAVLRTSTPGVLKTIINVASTGGKQGVVFAAAYSASKHGVVGFTKSLGLELAGKGITVNAVCPGFVETELAEKARSGYAEIWGVDVSAAKQRIEQRVPIGRYVVPDEVAAMVSYLASPRARCITAQALNVCGGLGNY